MTQPNKVLDFEVNIGDVQQEALDRAQKGFSHLQRLQNDSTFLAELGRRLWDIAFPQENDNSAFARALEAALARGGRLRLWLRPGSSELAALPWEYLCLNDLALSACRQQKQDIPAHQPYTTLPNPQTFVGLNPNMLLVRASSGNRGKAVRDPLGALKVLVVWANPRNASWPDIGGAEEEASAVKSILERLGASKVIVGVLGSATADGSASKDRLKAKLKAFKPNVLHFIGHGAFPGALGGQPADADPVPLRGPSLVLEGRHTYSKRFHDYLSAEELRPLCREAGVSVVVLNSCLGGRSDPRLTGVAQALATWSDDWAAPVVVAMQCLIPQTTALWVADLLYRALTAGNSFELALQKFRLDYTDHHDFGTGFWGIPVLFSSVDSTSLFEHHEPDADVGDPFAQVLKEATHFVERTTLEAEIEQFLGTQASGVFLLTAPAGLGKSAFLAHWVEKYGRRTRFFYRYLGHDSPLQCARRLYAVLHEHRCAGLPFDPPEQIEAAPDKLKQLLLEVSRRLPPGESEVLVIDGLDEAAGGRPVDAVPLPDELPPGIFALLAGRPEWLEGRQVPGGWRHYSLLPQSKENLDVARAFIAEHLYQRNIQLSEALVSKFVEQVEGIILIIKIVCDLLPLDIDETKAASVFSGIRTLSDAYGYYWDGLRERIGVEELQLVDDLLSLRLGALEAVSEEQFAAVLKRPMRDCRQALSHVRRFLATSLNSEEGVAYSFFHKSFLEFVAARTKQGPAALHRIWAEHCLDWRDLRGYSRRYALLHLPSHLMEAGKGA